MLILPKFLFLKSDGKRDGLTFVNFIMDNQTITLIFEKQKVKFTFSLKGFPLVSISKNIYSNVFFSNLFVNETGNSVPSNMRVPDCFLSNVVILSESLSTGFNAPFVTLVILKFHVDDSFVV